MSDEKNGVPEKIEPTEPKKTETVKDDKPKKTPSPEGHQSNVSTGDVKADKKAARKAESEKADGTRTEIIDKAASKFTAGASDHVPEGIRKKGMSKLIDKSPVQKVISPVTDKIINKTTDGMEKAGVSLDDLDKANGGSGAESGVGVDLGSGSSGDAVAKANNNDNGPDGFTSARDVMDKKEGKSKTPNTIADKKPKGGKDEPKKPSTGKKLAVAAPVATNGGAVGAGILIAAKLASMAKAAVMAAAAVVTKGITAIISVVMGVAKAAAVALGVSVILPSIVVWSVVAVVSVGSMFIAVGGAQILMRNDDGGCVPIIKRVSEHSQEYVTGEGELEAQRAEVALKVWSVLAAVGASDIQGGAILGNFEAESQMDPTCVETIYTEPFDVGDRKMKAWFEDEFIMAKMVPSYFAEFPRIKRSGIGLGQWTDLSGETGGRHTQLINFAAAQGTEWYDLDTQIKFLFAEGGDTPYRQKQLVQYLLKTDLVSVEQSAKDFMTGWIGLQPSNDSLSRRQASAVKYLLLIRSEEADLDYGNSIISDININRSAGNHAVSAYHQDDGCGAKIMTHYRNIAVDGTGEMPADIKGHAWAPESDEVQQLISLGYAKDPSVSLGFTGAVLDGKALKADAKNMGFTRLALNSAEVEAYKEKQSPIVGTEEGWTEGPFTDSNGDNIAISYEIPVYRKRNQLRGWYNDGFIQTEQCVGFASSYFTNIYPSWNQGGRPKVRPTGDGITTAKGWAGNFKGVATGTPQGGAVFSNKGSGNKGYGHTGIVQHVFANGDLLTVDANYNGLSGKGNNEQYTWHFRHIKKEDWSNPDNLWAFFKPVGEDPNWFNSSGRLYPEDVDEIDPNDILTAEKAYAKALKAGK